VVQFRPEPDRGNPTLESDSQATEQRFSVFNGWREDGCHTRRQVTYYIKASKSRVLTYRIQCPSHPYPTDISTAFIRLYIETLPFSFSLYQEQIKQRHRSLIRNIAHRHYAHHRQPVRRTPRPRCLGHRSSGP